MMHSGNCGNAAEGVTLSGISEKGIGPNVDRTLETLINLRAEGASVKHANLSGKRTKQLNLFF